METVHREVTVSNLKLDLDQLLAIIRQLDISARTQIAQALLETDMDTKFTRVLKQIAEGQPVMGISDSDIDAEVRAVRQRQP
ncbi:MAG: hypothetical protein GY862_05685 [Gammaproteobacteria bacterium]|nr:hypothetical protein [Gammaproteobacteria bacterium]